jgi:hypothetical protein
MANSTTQVAAAASRHALALSDYGPAQRGSRTTWLIIAAIVIAAIWFIASHASIGVTSPRIANPNVIGAPRPVDFLLGPDFIRTMEYGTVAMVTTIVLWCGRLWWRHPAHPYVLMTLAAFAIVWQDPMWNWGPYAVYNPQLWHWPVDWPWVRMSPTVEPFVVAGYPSFYFMMPFFTANWILRRLQVKASASAFVWRRPLVSMALLLFVVGFTYDAALEIFSIKSGLYIYSHVASWGSLYAGTTFQFPLIWESGLITLVMIPSGVLCYRDDTGCSVAEKLAQQLRWFPNRPALATFLVMFLILNIGYFAYGGGFVMIRAAHLATSVARPYPYPEAKIYDPLGFYEKAGEPGPYFQGFWTLAGGNRAPEHP